MTTDPTSLVLIGGGGHALVVAEAALAAGLRTIGFLDDNPDATLGSGDPSAAYLGPLTGLANDVPYHLAVGDLALRRRIIGRLAEARIVTIAHPTASVSPSAAIRPGVFIAPQAAVHTRARVGAHAIINTAAVVEHECDLGENCHIAPGAVLGGNVHVGPDTLVGLGSRILPGVRIGSGCIIGAGAVVTRDVPDGSKVVGIPARP